ncbi:rhamnulokinase family protein [Nesterenkonia sp. HG001]|uniref:rhamnulokinase n=1 Tax=Nesterenkonia sp. HG001 TaxID=2983207 RepID=UPI002AC4749D|nr:rhamnulokinase family protein [Nesterenkonia sp. HG001]MDZ5077181.1 rhamnulokinase [Nesterenkonia sp. HG001]
MSTTTTRRVTQHAAVDLGASSGRVVLGRVGPDTLELTEAARFTNGPVHLPDGLRWNLLGLFGHALTGLGDAVRAAEDGGGITSVGIDSWAVDYGLLARTADTNSAAPGGLSLLGAPFHYRDGRTAAGVQAVHRRVPFAELYRRNGLQFLPFNTLYQLAADELLTGPAASAVERALLVPDLLGQWLTGEARAEATNASTTGLVNVDTQDWDLELMERLGLAEGLFPEIAAPGTTLGETREELTPFLGGQRLPVTLVGSHDTASAIVGTPLSTPDAAYISCGTWGLVGLELEQAVVTDASREANFTNEGGVDGRFRFLTNVMGTWLLSETLRTWERETGRAQDLPALLEAAEQVPEADVVIIDVQDERFVPPGDMPARVGAWCTEHDVPTPASKPALVRCLVESIAAGFARALDDAARLAERRVDVVHMVGGGSLNALLCQATADRSGRDVIAGPVEATAIGNLLIQARTAGTLSGELEDLRELITRSHSPVTYRPRR